MDKSTEQKTYFRPEQAHLLSIDKVCIMLQKNRQNCFCHNYVKFLHILIIFGKKMARMIELHVCKMHSFSISPNL